MKNTLSLLCGLLFGAGLVLSGMTDTMKVLGFLDIFGNWIPDLIFVMGGALFITLVTFRFKSRVKPLLANDYIMPKPGQVDARLVCGAALFGIGWGLFGYCPGPALSALVYLDAQTLVFVVSMLVGMSLATRFEKRKQKL